MTALIIPTYKPSFLLKQTLASAAAQSQPLAEVIVVENGEKSDWLEKECEETGVHYTYLEKPGANNARNHGAKIATSDVLLFTDDDCMLDTDFVVNHILAHKRYDRAVVGGQVVLKLPDSTPEWLREPFRKPLAEVDWHLKFHVGNGDVDLTDRKFAAYLVTANMSVVRKDFEQLGGFDPRAGYIGTRLTPNDEFALMDAARDDDMRVMYTSLPIVSHYIPPERVQMPYLKERFWGQGYADAQLLFRQTENREQALYMCMDDILRKGSIADQLGNEEWDEEERVTAQDFARNLYICTACYMRGVMDYFHEFEDYISVSSQDREPATDQCSSEYEPEGGTEVGGTVLFNDESNAISGDST